MGAVDTLNLRPTEPLLGRRTLAACVILAVALAAGGYVALHKIAHRNTVRIVNARLAKPVPEAKIGPQFAGLPAGLQIPAPPKKKHKAAKKPSTSPATTVAAAPASTPSTPAASTPAASTYVAPTPAPTYSYTPPASTSKSTVKKATSTTKKSSSSSSSCPAGSSNCGSGTESIG